MDDIKHMSEVQLKEYLAQHRSDDRRFSEAPQETPFSHNGALRAYSIN